MKKFITICLVIIVTLSNQVLAADLPTKGFSVDSKTEIRTLVKEDFESYYAYYTHGRAIPPTYWNAWQSGNVTGDGCHVQSAETEKGRSIHFVTTGSKQNVYAYTSTMFDLNYNGDFVLTFDFKSDSNKAAREVLIRNKDGEDYRIFRWKDDGSVLCQNTTGGTQTLSTTGFSVNAWHHYKLVYDSASDSCNVFCDDTPLATNIKINNGMKNGMIALRFLQSGTEGLTCNTYYDNVALYSGKEEIEFSKIPAQRVYDDVFYDYENFASELKNAVVMKVDSPVVYDNCVRTWLDVGNENVTVKVKDGVSYVPIRFIAESFGANVSYDSANQIAYIKGKSGFEIDVDIQNNFGYVTFVDGKKIETIRTDLIEDRVYLPVRVIAEALGKTVTYLADDGIIVISKGKSPINEESEIYNDVKRFMSYSYPKAETIKKYYEQNNVNNVHPRIMLTPERVTELKREIVEDDFIKKVFKSIKGQADNIVANGKYAVWNPNGTGAQSNLNACQMAEGNIIKCSLLYLLTDEPKYKERVWNELENLFSWRDWGEEHYLDTAELTNGVAIAYDWLYNYWNAEERERISTELKRLGVDTAYYSFKTKRDGWALLENNWTFICNGGIGNAAMALFETNPDYYSEILEYNFISMSKALDLFAPYGAWEEGVGYWSYFMPFYIGFLDSLDNTFGTDWGYLSNVEGADNTGFYAVCMSGPGGAFNFHDSKETAAVGGIPELLWLGDKLNSAALVNYRLNGVMNGLAGGSVNDLLFYNSDVAGVDEELDLDTLYSELIATATLRSSWDSDALFAGIHGSPNDVNHGHLDIGTFVLDSQGVRFVSDLGPDTYGLTDSLGKSYLSSYEFYKRRAEGHNTIVINPPGTEWGNYVVDQNVKAQGIIDEFVSKERGAFVKMDISESNDSIDTAQRGLMLCDGREQVILQDEITLTEASDVYWFAHTKADITISDDGKSATLELDNKFMNVALQSDNEDLVFEVMNAEPLAGSPNPDSQPLNSDYKKLYIYGASVDTFNVAVVFTPQYIKGQSVQIPTYTNLDDWSIPDGEINDSFEVSLQSLMIDNQEISTFVETNEFKHEIAIGETEVPQIEVIATGNATVNVIQAEDLNDATIIELVDNDSGNKKYYSVSFYTKATVGLPENLNEIDIKYVFASAEPQQDNLKENSVDGDLSTRWSAEGEQWIMYDLGKIYPVKAVSSAWYNGNIRTSYFSVEVSEDGEQWTSVFDGTSCEGVNDYSTCAWENAVNARYVRISGTGNSDNKWNSITEVKIYQ